MTTEAQAVVLADQSVLLSRPVTDLSTYRPVHFQTVDGLTLFARDYSSANNSRVPVLCLPGLTRNSKDFETVAPWLAKERRVIALDFRGRGLSQRAKDPSSYRPDIELGDVITLLNFLKVERVAVVGTSRGGIVGMMMAALHGDRLAGLFLNDVGPQLEPAGLLRIGRYLGVRVEFDSWDEAIANLKSNNSGFELLTADEWQAFARRVFKAVNGLPRLDYDLALVHTFPTADEIAAGRIASLWEIYACTVGLPVSVLRGEHSDLLSAATVAAMKLKNSDLDETTVSNRGHAPFLNEAESKDAILRWLEKVDAMEKGR